MAYAKDGKLHFLWHPGLRKQVINGSRQPVPRAANYRPVTKETPAHLKTLFASQLHCRRSRYQCNHIKTLGKPCLLAPHRRHHACREPAAHCRSCCRRAPGCERPHQLRAAGTYRSKCRKISTQRATRQDGKGDRSSPQCYPFWTLRCFELSARPLAKTATEIQRLDGPTLWKALSCSGKCWHGQCLYCTSSQTAPPSRLALPTVGARHWLQRLCSARRTQLLTEVAIYSVPLSL